MKKIILLSLIIITACASGRFNREAVRGEVKAMNIGESRYIEIDGMKMHYLEAGKGDPLVLVHGWICWGAYWKHIIPLLSEKYHVYAVDLMGHGLSDRPLDTAVSYDTVSQSKLLIAFMDAMGIQKAHLVGHSMGGEIVARTALAAPEKINRLVLLCAAGLEENPRIIPWYLRLGRALRVESMSRYFFTERLMRIFTPGLMFHPKSPVPEDFLRDMAMINCESSDVRASVGKITREGLWSGFIDKQCPAIKAPTLIVYARHDKVVPAKLGARYHDLISNSKLIIYEDAGHMLPWEQYRGVAGDIAAFCR